MNDRITSLYNALEEVEDALSEFEAMTTAEANFRIQIGDMLETMDALAAEERL